MGETSSVPAFVEKLRILIQYLTTPTNDRVPPFFRIVDADPHWRHGLKCSSEHIRSSFKHPRTAADPNRIWSLNYTNRPGGQAGHSGVFWRSTQ